MLSKALDFSLTHPNHATLITLSGDLGAGKTTLTQAIARELGITENIISPTYIIMKNYALPPLLAGEGGGEVNFKALIHIDAYRLDSSDELLRLGWDKLMSDPNNLIILEWPKRVEGVLPKERIQAILNHVDEETRSIDMNTISVL